MFDKDPKLNFNLHDKHSPHSLVLPLVPDQTHVLDVGCNTGYIGEYLINKKGCKCDGVDYNKDFLQEAKKRGYANTFQIDLYYPNFHLEQKYDVLLFIDILEHLPNPSVILSKFVSENLSEGGMVIVCLPNIARFEHRLEHLFGKFDYRTSGALHGDHLRFFTRDTARTLIQKAGLRVVQTVPTGLGSRFKILPTLLAFQFILICKK